MARYFKKSTFQYTQEQAQAIKNGDLNARNKFYKDNYEILKMMAWKWVKTFKKVLGSFFRAEDLLNQVYLDLPYLYYDNNAVLAFWVRKSFKYSVHGGISFMRENHLTTYMKEENNQWGYTAFDLLPENRDDGSIDTSYMLDSVACSPSPEEELERRDSDNDLIIIRGILAEYLPARDCDLYLLCLDGYTVAEACRKLGISKRGKAPIENKLRPHAAEIVEKLIANGFESAVAFLGQSGYTPPVKVYKQSAEVRERNLRYTRITRERAKARKQAAELQGNAA